MARNLISLIVSEPRADPLTYPTQPGAGYIGFHCEKCAKESKFPPFPSFLNPFSSPCTKFLCSTVPSWLLPGISPVKIPARRRRKRDETSKTVKCTSLRHVRFNCICGLLNREASMFPSHPFRRPSPKVHSRSVFPSSCSPFRHGSLAASGLLY